jgi:hypothetical protein
MIVSQMEVIDLNRKYVKKKLVPTHMGKITQA